MNRKLRVLNLEDSPRDSALLRRHLEHAGFDLVFERIETSAQLRDALTTRAWDVILCDYSLPSFSALAALLLLKELALEIPFIVISGSIGEELAVELLLAGASDYLMKDKLARLVPAIERELLELENQRARRQVEAALKQSESELRALFAAINDVIFVLDAEGHYLKVAPTDPTYLYKPLDDLVGKTLHDVFPKEDADFFLQHLQRALAQGKLHRVEYRLQLDGREVWFEGSVSPMSHDSVVWIARDVTERKQAEEEKARLIAQLESQRQRLNNIVANVPGFVWEAWGQPDMASQRIHYVSEYVETMLGYSVDEWLTTPNFWLTLVHPDDQERAAQEAAANYTSGLHSRQEFRWIAKDGHIVWVESRSAAITDAQGQPVGLRGVTIDISERKQVEETLRQREAQLRHAQKMEALGTLAGGIAHDFNNVLGIIMGYGELAQAVLPEDSTVQSYLAHIQRASQRAKDLVQQILTFSRQQEHERRPLQLQPVLQETLQLLRATLPSTIEIRQSLDPNAPLVLADATQIHQVMMNLGTNAWHAMQAHGGLLEVTLAALEVGPELAEAQAGLRVGSYARLTVRDTGQGMNRATLERIYDPFFTTKAPGQGTGLGLAVVHGVVQHHRGVIAVSSELGQGTTFSLYFPSYRGVLNSPSLSPAPVPHPQREHILFIDDEESLAELGKMLLEHLGYRVTAQTSGLAAWELFRAQPLEFDLVITDQTMPRLTGSELAQMLLAERPTLPILLTTGYSASVSLEQAQAVGIKDLLMKPYNAQSLERAINNVLKREAGAG